MHPSHDDLVTAAQQGDLTAAGAALAAGASPDARDARGHTVLMVACARDDLALASLLLEAGASPNRRDVDNEETVLHQLARRSGATATLGAILERRVRVDRPDRFGWTPLMVAAQLGAAENVAALLAAGADPTLTTPDGRTAAELARDTGHLEVLGLLPDP
jgi:ankyrin repeat protein